MNPGSSEPSPWPLTRATPWACSWRSAPWAALTSASCAARAKPSSPPTTGPATRRTGSKPTPSGVLRDALAQSDSAAYLAYRVRDNHRAAHTATEYAEALAIVGCAADSLSSRRRPWEIEGNDLSLPDWRERVWKLLFAMPDNALPKPSVKPETEAKPCTCNETDSPKALAQEHADWCPAGDHSNERSRRIMSAMSDLDVRLQELVERYYNSLEDQLYDPDPKVDGYGKERQKQYILDLLRDLARDAATSHGRRPEGGMTPTI